jgi:Uncharacterized protein conserved in bacteria (DUF2330)
MKLLVLPSLVVAITLFDARVADACGCFSPPVSESDYAVNQSAEQIIFEVDPGWVTAHVLIRYAGDPSQFAWIIPVPEVPELGISPSSAFGMLDRATAPITSVTTSNLCPASEWACFFEGATQHGCTLGPSAAPATDPGHFADDASTGTDAGATAPPVDVIAENTVGDYATVTFRASEATAAVQWLRSNGFVVNATTAIYMESYIADNMVFVAAKLVPGAGTRSIKPLRMRYRTPFPSVPLVITAVASQPHLTVTSFIYGAKPFAPMSHPVVQLDAKRLALDPTGRNNYPMLLARTIDEAGGDGFVLEYGGTSAVSTVGNGTCCGTADTCNLGNNTRCECPTSEFDAADCAALPDLSEGVALLDALAMKYPSLTRITTRISPEEMTFDPVYAPADGPGFVGRIQLANTQQSLAACSEAVVEQDTYRAIRARQGCAAMYCGLGSACVTTEQGPACACTETTVAQQFIDLDGKPSVTCVPRTPTVDLRAGGDVLPDACATADCNGTCIDRNGIAVCACDPDMAAVATSTSAPRCATIVASTNTPGAQDYTALLATLDVCAPAPPTCAPGAKYARVTVPIVGVDCGNANPPDDQITDGLAETGCCQGAPPAAFFGGAAFVLALVLRRRRVRARSR